MWVLNFTFSVPVTAIIFVCQGLGLRGIIAFTTLFKKLVAV